MKPKNPKPAQDPVLVVKNKQKTLVLPQTIQGKCADLVRLIWRLRNSPTYQSHCDGQCSPHARYEPGNFGVCMGYDFHVVGSRPFLIEINTNALGLFFAIQEEGFDDRVLEMFVQEWQDWGGTGVPKRLAIVDETPEKQKGYREFLRYQTLFETAGISTVIVDPGQLDVDSEGFLIAEGARVSMVYLRLCDFYLDSAQARPIAESYVGGRVCVSPTPREYHLLADKRRLCILSDRGILQGLGVSKSDAQVLSGVVPETIEVKDRPADFWWAQRKMYVFKPSQLFASRGVYLGKTLTHHKLAQLMEEPRIAQRWVPAGTVADPSCGKMLKFDLRFFVYRNKVLGTVARLYEGMVTNFRSPFAAVVPVVFSSTQPLDEACLPRK